MKAVAQLNSYCLSMERIKLYVSILLFCGAASAHAQVNRYVVLFKDKANTIYSTAQPLAYLSQAAIDRRIKNGVAITEQDFPVNSSYVNEVKQSGAQVIHKSRWFNGVLIQCDQSLVATIEALLSVKKVELVASGQLSGARMNTSLLSTRVTRSLSAKTTTQLNMIGLDSMHSLGTKGEGVKVAIFDSGFPGVNTVAGFAHLQDNILDSYNFVNNQKNVFVNDDHGTEVLSVMAGYIANTFTGGAYNADYHLYITEETPTEYRVEEYNWLFAAERADSVGVDVINASLGYNTFDNSSMNYSKAQLDGKTAVVTHAAQLAAEKGIVVVVSAGNEGNNSWQTITPPADAKDVIATGSVTSSGARSPFSSIGPSADNRIKPDVCAMGSGTFVIRSNGNTGTASGTSLASPLLASLFTGLIQRYDTLTRAELLNLVKSTASLANMPTADLGYGVASFLDARAKMELITGLETPNALLRFDVFPNPVDSGLVFIQDREWQRGNVLAIELLDMQGACLERLSFTPRTSSDKASLNLSQVPSGVYIVRITTGNDSDIFKIVNVR